MGAIHTVTIKTRAPGQWAPNLEGRSAEPTASYKQKGRLCQLSVNETLRGSYGEDIVAVFLAPLDSKVTEKDVLVAECVEPHLDGTYEITGIRYTPDHLRVLLRRSQ